MGLEHLPALTPGQPPQCMDCQSHGWHGVFGVSLAPWRLRVSEGFEKVQTRREDPLPGWP